MAGLTQQQLGDSVGIKFQQIQKYEAGTNRISASRMWDIAAIMEVPVSFFFEGLDGQAPNTGAARGDILTDKEALDLVRTYYAIPENQRRRLFDLACILSDDGQTGAQFFDTDQVHCAERDVASAEHRVLTTST
jgi:transcriptional regulator with XRE-family HTH domain